ncbi:MAG TPA: hypothetical protein VK436_10895, partial [Methanocella sp.]|nr:hypothetical protein [Methanocella sp.]
GVLGRIRLLASEVSDNPASDTMRRMDDRRKRVGYPLVGGTDKILCPNTRKRRSMLNEYTINELESLITHRDRSLHGAKLKGMVK